jgi:hypothetical protein
MGRTNMVPYTTNFTNRTRTTAIMAVLATAMVIVVGAPVNSALGIITARRLWLAALVAAPSPMAVFGLLYWAYDSILWRWHAPVVGSRIPNLNGSWHGFVTFKDMGGSRLNCQVKIAQTWTRISVAFSGVEGEQRHTRSSVIMAALNREEVTGGLRYEYLVFPEASAEDQVSAIGTAHLGLEDNNLRVLEGAYHNQPQYVGGNWVHHFGEYRIERS